MTLSDGHVATSIGQRGNFEAAAEVATAITKEFAKQVVKAAAAKHKFSFRQTAGNKIKLSKGH